MAISINERIASKIESNKRYNDSIKEHDYDFDSLKIFDGNVIIRLFKIVENGGLGEQKFQRIETDGGKPGAKIEDYEYTTEGIVVKKPSKEYIDTIENESMKWRYRNLVENETRVLLNPSMMNNGSIAFYPNRENVVNIFEGYITVPVNFIQGLRCTSKD